MKENNSKEAVSTASPDQNNPLQNNLFSILLVTIAVPILSMSFWTMNLISSKIINSGQGFDEPVVISPLRWLLSCLVPIPFAVYGYKRKSLDFYGALVGLVVGFVMTLSNYCFLTNLIVFFLSSSKATKYGSHLKRKFEEDFKEGGQRTWVQVLCNGGMATQLGILYLLDIGACEIPINFLMDYRASWLSIGVLGTFACCNGDTWASELGTVLSNGDPILITTWKRVPKGTNGGISLIGTIVSTLGGLVIGISHYLTLVYFSDRSMYMYAPPQWPIILFGALGGFLGSLIDSILGATLQYSGIDKDGKIVSHSSLAVKHISGRNILDNHSVNMLSTVIMGLLLPTISKTLWPIK
ncbi:transmembrane protein 19 isoform X2 [Aricia agestis]|uniref:transmembrane protein 19 isoform X1 n=1 Tax=Aricia agestis TaxID=91739 RepID=UPI001C20221D|nr:transmembrane protein 19 isoform X1 [Aricia agestis]XP_041978877.1 transmembrane protein 19 isoform X2 [Aricia agestis]